MLAGAQRVEGCLFGNGERSGNVDLVTLALNLYTQGVHPGPGFLGHQLGRRARWRRPRGCRFIRGIRTSATSCSRRSPARIRMRSRKGFAVQKPDALWEVPYLPIDPADLGRTYERHPHQQPVGQGRYCLPSRARLRRRDAAAYAGGVQRARSAGGGCVRDGDDVAAAVVACSRRRISGTDDSIVYHGHHLFESGAQQGIELDVTLARRRRAVCVAPATGPIAATVNALRACRFASTTTKSVRLGTEPMRRRWQLSRLAREGRARQPLRGGPARQHRDGVGVWRC